MKAKVDVDLANKELEKLRQLAEMKKKQAEARKNPKKPDPQPAA